RFHVFVEAVGQSPGQGRLIVIVEPVVEPIVPADPLLDSAGLDHLGDEVGAVVPAVIAAAHGPAVVSVFFVVSLIPPFIRIFHGFGPVVAVGFRLQRRLCRLLGIFVTVIVAVLSVSVLVLIAAVTRLFAVLRFILALFFLFAVRLILMAVLLLFVVLATVLLLFLFRLIFAAVCFAVLLVRAVFVLSAVSVIAAGHVLFALARGFDLVLRRGGVLVIVAVVLRLHVGRGLLDREEGVQFWAGIFDRAQVAPFGPLMVGQSLLLVFILSLLDPFVVGFVFVPVRLLGEFRDRSLFFGALALQIQGRFLHDFPISRIVQIRLHILLLGLLIHGLYGDVVVFPNRFLGQGDFVVVMNFVNQFFIGCLGDFLHRRFLFPLGRRLFGLGGRRCVRRLFSRFEGCVGQRGG